MMRFIRNLRAAARQSVTDGEMTDEMRFHIEMEARDLVAGGMAEEEALRTARARFGGTMRYREEGRDARGSSWFSDLAQDIRYAGRTLGRNRAYAAVSILTLAIAIGSSATIFGVMNGVLLKPLPYPKPEKLFQIWDNLTMVGVPEAWVTGPEVAAMRDNLRSMEGIAVIRGGSAGISSDGGDPEQINFAPISANFFTVLGRGPEIGRGFLPEEDVPNGPRVAVISHALFQRRFAGDPSIVGKTMLFDGNPTTIVGVLPRDFQYALQSSLSTPLDVDVYTPIQVSLATFARGNHTFGVVARVKDGVSNATALAELARWSRVIDSTSYAKRGFNFAPIPVRDRLVRDVRPAIIALMLAVGLLMVTMCANLATLSLARTSRRQREFAVRRAIGAGFGRIARQVFTETMLISIAGAALGIFLAVWGVRGLLRLAPAGMPRRDEIGIDPMVVLFTMGLGILVGLVMGLAPLLHSMRTDIASVIGEKLTTGRGGRLRGTLVVAQVALSLVLLVGTGSLIGSFARLLQVDGGFRSEGAVLLSYVTPAGRYKPAELAVYHQRVVDRMRSLPGVTATGLTSAPPLAANSNQSGAAFPESPENNGDGKHDEILVDFMTAGPGYFKAMGIPIVEGREFTTSDQGDRGQVAIIDAQLAKRYFPRGSAVGKRISVDGDTADVRVIGVVATVYQYGLREAGRPQVYAPDAIVPYRGVTTVIRTTGDEAATMRAARAAFRELNPGQPIEKLTTMSDVVRQSLGQSRLVVVIMATFAVTALLLAAIGIYGVTSTAVTARAREMGIRIALGARPIEVLTLALKGPFGLVALGAVIGIAGTITSRSLLARLVYGISPTDPLMVGSLTVLMMILAATAATIPAARVMRVDAARVLRSD
jgi:predicted permease